MILILLVLFLRSGREESVPFEAELHLSIPLDDDDDPENPEEILSNLEISVPPGMTIDQMKITARIVEHNEE